MFNASGKMSTLILTTTVCDLFSLTSLAENNRGTNDECIFDFRKYSYRIFLVILTMMVKVMIFISTIITRSVMQVIFILLCIRLAAQEKGALSFLKAVICVTSTWHQTGMERRHLNPSSQTQKHTWRDTASHYSLLTGD